MFAQGWIPALGFSRGKFLWEANKTGVGKRSFLIGGFNYFVIFTPNLGEMIQFDWYFSNGLKPPTSILVQPRSSWHFFGIQVYCIIFLWDSRLLLVHQGAVGMVTWDALQGWKNTRGWKQDFRRWVANTTNGTPAKWLKVRLLASPHFFHRRVH